MLEVTVRVSGRRMADVQFALEEATRIVMAGFTTGGSGNADGKFSIEVTGDEEEEDEGQPA